MENTNAIRTDAANNEVDPNKVFAIRPGTLLDDLIEMMGDVEIRSKTPTPKKLREEAGEPVAQTHCIKVYSNGYAIYENRSGRTVLWAPACNSFTHYFDRMKDSEKGDEIKEYCELPEGLLGNEPWVIPITMVGDHRIEANSMNRTGSRAGTKDFDSDDNGDKDGDAEKAVEESYRSEFTWKEERIGEDPETIYIRKEQYREMLEELTVKQREVFLLYYDYGFKMEEIAEMLEISAAAVKHHLDGGIKKIKKIGWDS